MNDSIRIQIVDRGRGPQLSTSRITVQDVLPYLIRGDRYEQIQAAMPILTIEEIKIIEGYIAANREEVMAEDARIRARNASRRNPPHVEDILAKARKQRLAWLKDRVERNGTDNPG